MTVCRTGYTGEHGYELLVEADAAGELWDALLESGQDLGIRPCGLGARDTLRTEMGYPLHGHELSLEITPDQARSGWAVGWKKPAFWGRDALLAEKEAGPARLLWGLRATGRGIPRPGMAVLGADGGPDRRGHQRHVLADPAHRHRAGAARHRRRRGGGRRAERRRARPAAGGARSSGRRSSRRTCADASGCSARVGSLSPFCGSGESGSVSAISASRAPIGCGSPSVVSCAVWCSASALISAPSSTR